MLIGVVHAGAQSTEPTELRARRATTSPKIDGILDDEVWSGDPLPLERWVSYNPLRGEPARQRTSVWIAYDDRAVYFAFRCSDAEPEKIRTTITRRDNAWNDDWVAISLDSSRAGQVAYHMFVNPSGIQMDALNTGSNGEDSSPDWIWQSAGHIDEQGYTVEIRLPLESIRFRGGSDVRMGVMFFRLALNDHEAGQPIPIFRGRLRCALTEPGLSLRRSRLEPNQVPMAPAVGEKIKRAKTLFRGTDLCGLSGVRR